MTREVDDTVWHCRAVAGNPRPLLTTERLTVRPLQVSDFAAIHAVYSDPLVTRFIPGGARDHGGCRQRLEELIAHHDRHGVSKWAVELTGTAQVIGDCGLQYLPGTGDLELGFHLARAYWGRGYATEAAAACLAWAVAERTERIIAIVDPRHRASQHILEKIGMHAVSHIRLLDRTWNLYEAAGENLGTRTTSPAPLGGRPTD